MGIFSKDKKNKAKENSGSFYSDKPYNVSINKYNSKQAVLDLIAYISTADNDFDADSYFHDFYKNLGIPTQYHQIPTNLKEEYKTLLRNFSNRLWNIVYETSEEIGESGGSSNIKIAVGGGYSSGKSSFLNSFLNLGRLLPTGPVPVSVVNTFLNTSVEVKNVRVKGKNLKNSYVLLDEEVLECIQHASESKTYVASVLETLIIDLPAPSPELKNITFIDTPGYNNSNTKNTENNRTDLDTAMEAYSTADAVIWCIDMEGGTVPETDLKILKDILEKDPDKPIAIIFTKRDKKPESEQKKIILNASSLLRSKLPAMPKSVMAFSDRVEKRFMVAGLKSLDWFINEVRNKTGAGGEDSIKTKALYRFNDEFDELTRYLQENYEEWEKRRVELSAKKSETSKNTTELKDFNKAMLGDIRILVGKEYPSLVREREQLIDYIFEALKGWDNLRDIIVSWLEDASIFSGRGNLQYLLQQDFKKCEGQYDKVKNYLENLTRCFNDDDVKDILKDIEATYKYFDDDKDIIEDSVKEDYDNVVRDISLIRELIEFIRKWKRSASDEFEHLIVSSIYGIRNHMRKVPTIKRENSGDIFSAIASDNISRFVDCLSAGVNMSECNTAGFTPQTYVARSGNNQMMRYLIDHGVNLNLADKRGYTPFETAVMCHYQDICEMLLEADKELADTSYPIEELLNANKFTEWINEKCR